MQPRACLLLPDPKAWPLWRADLLIVHPCICVGRTAPAPGTEAAGAAKSGPTCRFSKKDIPEVRVHPARTLSQRAGPFQHVSPAWHSYRRFDVK
jgi:hypothetical protein